MSHEAPFGIDQQLGYSTDGTFSDGMFHAEHDPTFVDEVRRSDKKSWQSWQCTRGRM